jgi:hypothetical protein
VSPLASWLSIVGTVFVAWLIVMGLVTYVTLTKPRKKDHER